MVVEEEGRLSVSLIGYDSGKRRMRYMESDMENGEANTPVQRSRAP